uniref:Uncharacterized protein n=1 Tax=Rhizophora mucronata TaxID=61149 RepID=A0A2P2Q1V2_RHIMU
MPCKEKVIHINKVLLVNVMTEMLG